MPEWWHHGWKEGKGGEGNVYLYSRRWYLSPLLVFWYYAGEKMAQHTPQLPSSPKKSLQKKQLPGTLHNVNFEDITNVNTTSFFG